MSSHSQISSPPEKSPSSLIASLYDRTTLEGLMYQYWRKDTVTAERKRIRQTWFDYRHAHPVARSLIFVEEYNRAHQRAYKRFYGKPASSTSDLPRNAHSPLYRRPGQAITAVLGRMHLVDELGCPYDTFFDAALSYYMQERGFETWKGDSEFLADLPLPPLQMCADAVTLISSQKAFEKKNDIRLRLPEHKHYHTDNWHGTSNQKACSKWLIKQVQNRRDRNLALSVLCYDKKLIREAEVVRQLSVDTVKKMRDIRNSNL